MFVKIKVSASQVENDGYVVLLDLIPSLVLSSGRTAFNILIYPNGRKLCIYTLDGQS